MANRLTAGFSASSTSLLAPAISLLAEPPNNQVDAVLHDYLLIEIVNTLRTSSAVATKRMMDQENEMVKAGLIPSASSTSTSTAGASSSKKDSKDSRDSFGSQLRSGQHEKPLDETEEAVRIRLESMGMHVGANLAERLSRDRPRFVDTLDTIKFICKDVWSAVWDKQVDNLRTNHRGVYVLQDNAFRPLTRISSPDGAADALRRAKIYVAFPAGVIRGALSRMGLQGTVVPEIPLLPQCTFQIKLPKNT